jgi:TatD DNase family protein
VIDTHAHVHDKAFDMDRREVVARMHAAGVVQAITVGCDLADSRRAVETAQAFSLLASVGIHPHEAKDAPADLEAALDPLLRAPCAIAIGETGLDYYYGHSPREVQQQVLRAHIAIARERELPVIFHHRDAFGDFTRILNEEWRAGMRGVVHCFTGDTGQAKTFTQEFGLTLGIGGVLTFKNAQRVRDAVRACGLDAVLLETDCPYLAPVPHRGERNEPSFVAHTARYLAELLGEPLHVVEAMTTDNARGLFGLSPGSIEG